jgi:hypothetical protein
MEEKNAQEKVTTLKIRNKYFEGVKQFKYLGKTLTSANSIHEQSNGRSKSGAACSRSVQNLLSPSFMSNNINIKIYRHVILHVVFDGCETWCLILMKERRLRAFEHMMLRRIFKPNRDEVTVE